jgi:hypothetical protein
MSSTIYAKQNPSPAVTRRTPISIENTENGSRHSLSGKLRNLFRKNSSSPNRIPSNDRPPPTTSVRQSSASPASGQSSTEAPHLRAPTFNWPFGKKKTKLSTTTSTPTTSKKKKKDSRKTNQTPVRPIEISSPIYQQENPTTSMHGQYFTPRTPELVHDSSERLQSSSSYEVTTKGFRDYVIIDQTRQYQQVITLVIRLIRLVLKQFSFYFLSSFFFCRSNLYYDYNTNTNNNNSNNNNNNNQHLSFVST